MPPVGSAVAITPAGVIAGDPAVLAELCARRGTAVLAFVDTVCDEGYCTRAAADAFARFRAEVAGGRTDLHPETLLMRAARRAALELSPPGPDLGCAPARILLATRAERTIAPEDNAKLSHHLRVCDFCRGLAQRVAAGEDAYRDAEEGPVPAEVAAAVVAAMVAAAPLGFPIGPEPARPPEVEPRVAKPEQVAPEPEAEPVLPEPEPVASEPEFVLSEPASEDVAAAPAARAVLPYYEIPAPAPRRARRSWGTAEKAQAIAGTATALSGRVRAKAQRALARPSSEAEPLPIDDEPPARRAPEPWTAPDDPVQVTSAAAVTAPEAPVSPEPSAARRAVRTRTTPPRLPRPRRERRHRPLRDHSRQELAIPAGLLVAAVLVILAVAGVFGGSTSEPTVTSVRVSQPSRARVAAVPPSSSATAVSLERAAVLIGAPPAVVPSSSPATGVVSP